MAGGGGPTSLIGILRIAFALLFAVLAPVPACKAPSGILDERSAPLKGIPATWVLPGRKGLPSVGLEAELDEMPQHGYRWTLDSSR